VKRELPLCPYPQQARYDGKGPVESASSWACASPRGKRVAR
jgi:hypothetical protein